MSFPFYRAPQYMNLMKNLNRLLFILDQYRDHLELSILTASLSHESFRQIILVFSSILEY